MRNSIIKMIEKSNFISFDIFDTLLFRNISKPTDIFDIVEKELFKEFGVTNFKEKRIEAEKNSRKFVENGESNYDEIYVQLEKNIKNKKILLKAKELELKIEKEFLVINPFMKTIYDYCINNNKKIMLISDMYLPRTFIEDILKDVGYNIPENIYISNEIRKNKGSGMLYTFVHETEKIDYETWLHIGDNNYSDVEIPQSFGIKCFYYRNINEYDNYEPHSIMESIILAMRNNYIYNGLNIDYWKLFGIKNIFPIYFGFADWLCKLTENADNLFFLARDGYIIEKIYNLLAPSKKTKYIYVSRNSLVIPTLAMGSKDFLINSLITPKKNYRNLREIFNLFKLYDEKKYLKNIKMFNFNSLDDEINADNIYSAKKCVSFFLDESIQSLKNQAVLAKKYLIQEGLNDYKVINIVDIGWGGSTQNAISDLLNKDVKGFYFGTINIGLYDYFSKTYGYLFDQGHDKANYEKIFSQLMMYELMFSAPHGSTKRYELQFGKIVPILKEKDDFSNCINNSQQECLEIIKELLKYYKYYDSLDRNFCNSFYDNFLNEHNYNDMLKFSEISNDVYLGDFEKYPYVQIISKKEVKENFNNYKDFGKKSLWQGSFVVKDCNTIEEYKEFIKTINQNLQDDNKEKIANNFTEQKNISKKEKVFIVRKIYRRIFPKCLRKFSKKILKK